MTTFPWYAYVWWCHRLPERSFVYHGKPLPVCSRCTGLWLGHVVAVPLVLVLPLFSWWLLVGLSLPLLLDGGSQYLNLRTSTNWLRLITGILAGIAQFELAVWLATQLVSFGYQTGLQWWMTGQ